MTHPEGLALYLRALNGRRSPRAMAKHFRDHGLRWVAIGGPWHDKRGERWLNPPARVKRYADAFAALGVRPYVWGYPWHDRIALFVEHMEACTGDSIVGWLPDPELGLKGRRHAASDLYRACRLSNPYRELGFTSYGLAKGHPTFPWEEFAEPGVTDPIVECDWGSPQIYDMPAAQIRRSLTEYRAIGFDILVPSFGCYKRLPSGTAVSMTDDELLRHFRNILDSGFSVPAMIGWAENFTDQDQWLVMSKVADEMAG